MPNALRETHMIFNVLKNDLKRKKSINLILFLFIILASLLMAGSTHVLFSTSTAISRMMEEANVPDMSVFTFADPVTDGQVEDWVQSSDKVKSIHKEGMLMVMSDAFYSDGKIVVGKEDIQSVLIGAVPETNSLVYDQNDHLLILEKGEIAIPMSFHNKYDLNIGEKMSILTDNRYNDFTIAAYEKDIVFGSDMMGVHRFIISSGDYAGIETEGSKDMVNVTFWSIETPEGVKYREVAGEFGSKAINSFFILGKSDIDSTYLVSKLIAVIMIIVSLFLILITFLILRFTLVFTIQEDYREIGVMKAIGIKNRAIRRLYIIKYFAISLIGGAIGFALSFIYSGVMLKSISSLFVLQSSRLCLLLSALSSVLVVVFSILFCFICTNKINKISVIDAIRQGNTGERFSKSRKIHLFKMLFLKPADYLSLGDLMNGFKKFAVLTITFIIGTLLVLVPLNIINTLKDTDTMVGLFGLPPYDVGVFSDEMYHAIVSNDQALIEKEIIRIEGLFSDEGYPIELHAERAKLANMYTTDSQVSINVNAWQSQDYDISNFNFLEGSAPVLENEIAITTKMSDYFDISTGDSVTCRLQGNTYTFIVTGLYQSMMGMGANIRLSEAFELSSGRLSSLTVLGKLSVEPDDLKQTVADLQLAFPDLSISSKTGLYDTNLGGTVKMIDDLKNLIVSVVLGIIFLITCLIVRMLISREIPEIALLKSIGFRHRQLRRWQIGRIAIILILSIIVGTALAGSLGGLLVSGVFRIMGATEVGLVIEPIQVYLIYPAALLASTILAAAVSIGQIKKTKVWEINNQE